MARRKVEEIRCDRCKRVEYQDVGAPTYDLDLMVRSSLEEGPVRQVRFTDLCQRCLQVVLGLADSMSEISRRSSVAKKEEGDSRAVDGQLPPPHR